MDYSPYMDTYCVTVEILLKICIRVKGHTSPKMGQSSKKYIPQLEGIYF
jgi:hypothetical protein